MTTASTAPPLGPLASVSLSASQLSDITTALQSVQTHFQSLSQSLSLVTSVFLQLSAAQQSAGRRGERRADDEAEEEADAEAAQPARSDVDCDETDESGDVDAEERRRDDSGIARALEEEQKRSEQPEALQWSRSPAAVYSLNSKPANVWRKAAQLNAPQPTAAAASASTGSSSLSPTRTRSPLHSETGSFSPRTPPLTSSIVALPPLSAAALPRNAAIPPLFSSGGAHQPRVPQLSDARRKSTGSDGGDEEESKRNQQTAVQPLASSFLPSSSSASASASAVTAASTKRATTPLAAAHVSAPHFTTAAVTGEGRAGRTGSDSSAPALSSPRSSRPASASVLRPLRTTAAGLDDAAEDESLQPPPAPTFYSAPHAFASSTPTSPASRHIFLSQPNKVKLNVGGTVFHTTLSTLTSPAASSSMLHSIFSSQHFPLELDSKGAYFLDRDPSLFRLILNFLRDGSLSLSTLSPHTKQSLLREARYFALEPLVVSLQAELRQTQARLRRELSQEKEYRLVTAVEEKELAALFQRMTMMEGYDFEDWIMAAGAAVGPAAAAANRGSSGTGIGGSRDREKERAGGGCVHVLFSKKLSRGELMLLDRLQTGM